jgi:hypothetical protein
LFFVVGPSLEETQQGIAARNPAQVLVIGPRERQPLLVGQALPAAVVVFGGVGEDSVQVEDKGAD